MVKLNVVDEEGRTFRIPLVDHVCRENERLYPIVCERVYDGDY